MGLTYNNVLEKVESGEIEILEGIVKSGLGKEYRMSELKQITADGTRRARKVMMTLDSLKYSPDGKNVAFLSNPKMQMDVYLRVLVMKDGELGTRDVYLAGFSVGGIARGLEKFKSYLAAARTDAKIRLNELVERKKIRDFFVDNEYGDIILFNTDSDPRVFKTDLYSELTKMAKELFKG
jgi:hypothetical protein